MVNVSIIINCHNGEKYLRDTLKSLRNQSYTDFEVIFYDNCSNDSSAKIAKTFDSRLKYYRSELLIPLGAARNEALKLSQCEYVAFCDCDDIWEPEKLEKQMKEFSDDNVGMVFSNFKRYNMLSNKVDIFDRNAIYKKLDFSELVCNYSFCLSSFIIKKNHLKKLDHCFNEEFQYAEEFELFSRIAYNCKTVYLPNPLVIYRIHNKMTTLKVEERIGIEYGIALENLRKMDSNIDVLYPKVVKEISYRRDFYTSKYLIKYGKNKEVRALTKPYILYNKRTFLFYILAFFPSFFSKKIIQLFYKKRI